MATKSILVLDPSDAVGELLALLLGSEGYRVATATSLQQGARLLSERHFDLLITEAFGQGRGPGFDPTFLTELRSPTGTTPIILFSTYVSSRRVQARDLRLAGAVPKPCGVDDLVRKVHGVLDQAQ